MNPCASVTNDFFVISPNTVKHPKEHHQIICRLGSLPRHRSSERGGASLAAPGMTLFVG
jgi:hypothetical protein